MPILGRITKTSEYTAVRAANRKWVSTSFIMLFRVLQDPTPCSLRVGYTTSRKLGSAVVRNRIRRRLKEAFRLSAPGFSPQDPTLSYEVVIIGRTNAGPVVFADLVLEMKKALQFISHQKVKS